MFSFFRKKAGKRAAKQDGAAGKDENTEKDGVARESDANKKTCQKSASAPEERVENTRQVLQNSSKNTHAGFSESEASVAAIPASNSYASTHNERKQRNYDEYLTCDRPKLNDFPGKPPDKFSEITPPDNSSINNLNRPAQYVNSNANNEIGSKNTALCIQHNHLEPFKQEVSSPLLIKSQTNSALRNTFFSFSNDFHEKHAIDEVPVITSGQQFTPIKSSRSSIVSDEITNVNENLQVDIPKLVNSDSISIERSKVSTSSQLCKPLPPVIDCDLQSSSPKIHSSDCIVLDCLSDKEKLTDNCVVARSNEGKNHTNITVNAQKLKENPGQPTKPLLTENLESGNSKIKFQNYDKSIFNQLSHENLNFLDNNINSYINSEKNNTRNLALVNKHSTSYDNIVERVPLKNTISVEIQVKQNDQKLDKPSINLLTEKLTNRKGSIDDRNTQKEQYLEKNVSNTILREEGTKLTKQNRKSKDFYSAFFDTKKKIVDTNEIPQTNKEVINLLLPEDCVKSKKEESYLFKTGVQNFFDKMAGGKGKGRSRSAKNKKKQNANNTGNRSWSFNGLKSKEPTVIDETPETALTERNANISKNIVTAGTAVIIGEIKSDIVSDGILEKKSTHHELHANISQDNTKNKYSEEDHKKPHVVIIPESFIESYNNTLMNNEHVDHPVFENNFLQHRLHDEKIESYLSSHEKVTKYDKEIESYSNSSEKDRTHSNIAEDMQVELQFSELSESQNNLKNVEDEIDIINQSLNIKNKAVIHEYHETENKNKNGDEESSLHSQSVKLVNDSLQSIKNSEDGYSIEDSTIKNVCKQTEGCESIFRDDLSMSSENISKNIKPTENVNEGISLCDFNDPVKTEAAEELSSLENEEKNYYCNDTLLKNIPRESLQVNNRDNDELARELDLYNATTQVTDVHSYDKPIINEPCENSTLFSELSNSELSFNTTDENNESGIIRNSNIIENESENINEINIFKKSDSPSLIINEDNNCRVTKKNSIDNFREIVNPISTTNDIGVEFEGMEAVGVLDSSNQLHNSNLPEQSFDKQNISKDFVVNTSPLIIISPEMCDEITGIAKYEDELFTHESCEPLEKGVKLNDQLYSSVYDYNMCEKSFNIENNDATNGLKSDETTLSLPEVSCKHGGVINSLESEILTPVDNFGRCDSTTISTEIIERGVESNINVTSREPSGIFANSVDERKEFISGAKIPQYDTKCDSASIKTTHEIIGSNENISAPKTAVSYQELKKNEHVQLTHNNGDPIVSENRARECASTEIDSTKLSISTSFDPRFEAVNSDLTSSDLFWKPPGLPAANLSPTEQMGGADSKQKDKKKFGRGSPPSYTNFEVPDRRSARESFSLPPDDFRVAGVSKRGSLNSLPGSSKLPTTERKGVYEDDFKNIYFKDERRRMGQLPGDVMASSNDSGVVLEKDFKNSFINSSNIKYDLYGNEIKEIMDCTFEEGSSEDSGIKCDVSGEEKILKHILRDSIFGEDCTDERTKKKVTFDTVIKFDDGDKINDENLGEDDSAVDSFASFEEIDENDEEFEIENEEVPIVVLAEHDFTEVEFSKRHPEPQKNVEPPTKLFKSKSLDDVSTTNDFKDARCVIDEVENNENLGLENDDSESGAVEIVEVEDDSSEKSDSLQEETADNLPLEDLFKDIVQEAFKNVIETKKEIKEESEDESSGSEGSYEEVEEEEEIEEEVESCEEEESEVCSESLNSEMSESEKLRKSEVESARIRNETRINNNWRREEQIDDSAYADMLRIFEKQLRGLADKEGRLADLQERAAALHRVQGEVCNARKEAELVTQKLRYVEGDLAATRARNCYLLDQLEHKADEARAAEKRAEELSTDAMRLREQLDRLLPECEDLRKLANTLSQERDNERKDYEQALARERSDRDEREKTWRDEFERLRSQGAENEELLLADCEWKLRDVQKAARDRCTRAEQRLQELQKAADERCEAADKHLEEMTLLKSTTHDQQRSIRQGAAQLAQLQSSQASLQQETTRLRSLLDMEKDALATQRAQHAKELDEKDKRLAARLEEQAKRLEQEWKAKHQQKEQDCAQHAKAIKDAQEKVEVLKKTLSKKESQFEESLDKAKTRADWELLEMRRILDKAEIKYAEAVERLQDTHASETERLTEESERKVKELESTLSSQACSARATLELVRGQLRSEHAEALQRLKEAHRADMEKQWELFTDDKETCLERMKAECMLEGEEDREKRDKQLLSDIAELKSSLAAREGDLGSLKSEARKANDARVSAERRLSEAQVACAARETATRAEAARQAETAQREAKETIDHLNKKCVCLSNLFEDMRSRWQQAPGEAAQLRRALQDERARAAALRRQLDAMSRAPAGDGSTATGQGALLQKTPQTTEATAPESAAVPATATTPLKSITTPTELTKAAEAKTPRVKKSVNNDAKPDSDTAIKPKGAGKKGVGDPSSVVASKGLNAMNASVDDVKKDIGKKNQKVSEANDSGLNESLCMNGVDKIETNLKNDQVKRTLVQKPKEKPGYCNFIEANINNVSLNRTKIIKTQTTKLEVNRTGQMDKMKQLVPSKDNQKQESIISEVSNKNALIESVNPKTASRVGINKVDLINHPDVTDTPKTVDVGEPVNNLTDGQAADTGNPEVPVQINVKSNDIAKVGLKNGIQKTFISKDNASNKSIPKSMDKVGISKIPKLKIDSVNEIVVTSLKEKPKETTATTDLPKSDIVDVAVDNIDKGSAQPVICAEVETDKSFGAKFLKTFLTRGNSIDEVPSKRMVLTGGVKKAASLFDKKVKIKSTTSLERLGIDEIKQDELESGPQAWLLAVSKQSTKRRGRVMFSPPRDPPVELPQVTVPVRIRQFDPNRYTK